MSLTWQLRLLSLALSGVRWSLPVYQNIRRLGFCSSVSSEYMCPATISLVPPWKGRSSP